jgi:hypothetical protein
VDVRYNAIILFDGLYYNITTIRSHDNLKMGQMLSREDEEECDQPTEDHDAVHEEKEKEKPKRRQRNTGAALRSRKVRSSAQGRTRRNRTNPVTFDIRDH